MSGRAKVQTEMVTFRAPAGTKQELDIRARSEGYKDRSALILEKIGVSQETALEEGETVAQNVVNNTHGSGGEVPSPSSARANSEATRPLTDPDSSREHSPSSSAGGKDKLERAHETMAKVADRPLLTHAHAANCPCSICTKSG